jgi:hypothetical protein
MGAAWYNIYEQNKRAEINSKEERDLTHFKIGVEILAQEIEKFEKIEFRKTRKLAAAALLAGKKEDSNVYDVIDFFDTMGLLIRRNALDKEMVMSTFFDCISGYWHASSDYIHFSTQQDSLNYNDFNLLYKRMVFVCESMGGKETLDDNAVKTFLKSETELPCN